MVLLLFILHLMICDIILDGYLDFIDTSYVTPAMTSLKK